MCVVVEIKAPLFRDDFDEPLGAGGSAMAAREAKFLWKLFGSMNLHGHASLFCKRVDLFSDSLGVVAVATNPVLSSATKHIEIADFFVRETGTEW